MVGGVLGCREGLEMTEEGGRGDGAGQGGDGWGRSELVSSEPHARCTHIARP